MPRGVNDDNAILARKDLIASVSFVSDKTGVSPKQLHEREFYNFVNVDCLKCGDDRYAIGRLTIGELLIGSDAGWDAIWDTIAMGVMHFMAKSGKVSKPEDAKRLMKMKTENANPTREQLEKWFDDTYK